MNRVSRPARGAWVEINVEVGEALWCRSRPARGAWVEIFEVARVLKVTKRRAPQGARGLKLFDIRKFAMLRVAPRKGRVG